MTPQEKNWLSLFGQYSQEGTTWHAQVTVYSLDLEVIRAFKFTRKFSANVDQTIIYHHNTSYFDDGNVKEKSWQLNKDKCNQPDGVFHPEADSMRAIGFGNDTSIWAVKQAKYSNNFGSEVFINQAADWRHGIIPIYQDGEFSSLVVIKENKNHFPESVDHENCSFSSGNWQVKQIKMTPDLQEKIEESTVDEIDFMTATEDAKTYYFPEKIVLKLSPKIIQGEEFAIIVGKQTSDTEFKQVETQYDANGQLIRLVSSEFECLA
jgi:hypothetical protein